MYPYLIDPQCVVHDVCTAGQLLTVSLSLSCGLNSSQIQSADGLLVAFDVTSSESFVTACTLINELKRISISPVSSAVSSSHSAASLSSSAGSSHPPSAATVSAPHPFFRHSFSADASTPQKSAVQRLHTPSYIGFLVACKCDLSRVVDRLTAKVSQLHTSCLHNSLLLSLFALHSLCKVSYPCFLNALDY